MVIELITMLIRYITFKNEILVLDIYSIIQLNFIILSLDNYEIIQVNFIFRYYRYIGELLFVHLIVFCLQFKRISFRSFRNEI